MTRHYFSYIGEVLHTSWNQVALSDYGTEVAYTYGQMAEQMARLNILFNDLGLKAGDHIAICGRNSSNWVIAYLAIAAFRGVVVSILPDFTSENIENLVNHSDAKLLFVGPFVKSKVEPIVDKMPNLCACINLADFSLMYSNAHDTENVFALLNEHFSARYPNGFTVENVNLPTDNLDELALINYTSGTTSSPKGVMITHRNLSANVTFGQENIKNEPGWQMVSMLPLAHMFGLMFECLYQLAGGCHIYLLSKQPTPSILMRAFADVHPYMILTVPMVIEKIFRKKVFPVIKEKKLVRILWYMPIIRHFLRKKVYKQVMDAFGGHLEHLIIGGAALNEEVELCMKQIHFPFTVGYGMTECAPIIGYARWNTYKFRSCGRIIHSLEDVKIDSADPEQVVGEILVKGENVMDGYYKNEEATRATFTKDGWLKTGDLGLMDKGENIFIRGRNKNLILGSSGQNIYPEEIEDKLNSMTGVVESLVVDRDGKLVGLVFPDAEMNKVLEKEGRTWQEVMAENVKLLNAELPTYSQLAHIEILEQEFEKTPKRSIKRFMYQ